MPVAHGWCWTATRPVSHAETQRLAHTVWTAADRAPEPAAVVERELKRRLGVLPVAASPVAQTVVVTYDAAVVSPEKLRDGVARLRLAAARASACRATCAPSPRGRTAHRYGGSAAEHLPAAGGRRRSRRGPRRRDMSMAAMARALRDRFIVAAALAVPIMLWSPMGTALLGRALPAPFGMSSEVFQLLLSIPVVFYSSSVFFSGALRALRNRTLDMMVLVAVAIGAGWLYSVAVTFWIGGEVFYEAAAFLAAFVLLGHWLEMRARGGAQRGHPRAARPRAADGARASATARRSRCRPARSSSATRSLVKPGRQGARRRRGRSRATATWTSRWSPARACRWPRRPGDALIGATINGTGALRARASAVGADTALAQIVKLVQEAQSSKAPAQRLADRAAFWLVLVALIGGARHLRRLARPGRRQRVDGAAVRHHRRRHHLPRRSGAGDADRGDGRHRPRRAPRHPVQERRGAGADRRPGHRGAATRPARSPKASPAVAGITALDAFGRGEALALAAAVEAQSEHPLARRGGGGGAGGRHRAAAGRAASRRCPATAPPAGSARGACWSATRACSSRRACAFAASRPRATKLAGAGRTVGLRRRRRRARGAARRRRQGQADGESGRGGVAKGSASARSC